MRLSCLQENLCKALSIVGRITTTKGQLPALENILLTTDKERLKLSATNLETGISFWLGAKIEKQGTLLLPARAFSELVSSFPAEKITLEASDNILKISCGPHEITLNGLAAGEFPAFTSFQKEKNFSLEMESFLNGISQVIFSAAQDEGRPVLTGVQISKGKKGIALASTDGYRLSLKESPSDEEWVFDEIVISAKSLAEVLHVFLDARKEKKTLSVAVNKEGGQAVFSTDSAEIYTRLIGEKFPSFEKIIPQGYSARIYFEKEDLLKAVKITSVFARDASNIVKWEIKDDRAVISANSPQVGTNRSEIPIKKEGENGEIAFNYRYLLDFLGAVSEKELVFEMAGPLAPGVFRLSKDSSYLHIIMPVRVQGQEAP